MPETKKRIELPLVGTGVVHSIIPDINSWPEQCFAPWTIDDGGVYIAECPHRIFVGVRHAAPQRHTLPHHDNEDR